MDIVVLIATHNRPGLLRRTLESLAECELPQNYRETLIVENGGQSGAEAIVKEFEDRLKAKYLYEEQANKSIALNRGLETLDDVLVFFTDDDARFHRNILIEYAKAANGINGGVFFGGPLNVDYEKEPEEWLMKYLPYSVKGWDIGESMKEVNEPVFLGINWAAFSNDIKASGGFNPYFGPGSWSGGTGQETEMQKVLLRNSIKGQYLPDSVAWHHVPVESITHEWIFERTFKHRITKGINMEICPTFFGIPKSLIKEWFLVRYHMLYQSLRGDREGRFWSRQYKYRVKGMIKGYRLKRKIL